MDQQELEIFYGLMDRMGGIIALVQTFTDEDIAVLEKASEVTKLDTQTGFAEEAQQRIKGVIEIYRSIQAAKAKEQGS